MVTTLSRRTSWTRTSRRPSSIRRRSSASSAAPPRARRRAPAGVSARRSSQRNLFGGRQDGVGRVGAARLGDRFTVRPRRSSAPASSASPGALRPVAGRQIGVDPQLSRAGAVHSSSRSTAAAVAISSRRPPVDHLAVHPPADRPPEVLLDLAPRSGCGEAPSEWSIAAWAMHAAIRPARANESAPLVCASQIRSSTVPNAWCGRTLHHSWVDSTTEFVADQVVDEVRVGRVVAERLVDAAARKGPGEYLGPHRGQPAVPPVEEGRVGRERRGAGAAPRAGDRRRRSRGPRPGRPCGREGSRCCSAGRPSAAHRAAGCSARCR